MRHNVGVVLRVPLQDGATLAQGTVVDANDRTFRIRLDDWPDEVIEYDQDTPGVALVADG